MGIKKIFSIKDDIILKIIAMRLRTSSLFSKRPLISKISENTDNF